MDSSDVIVQVPNLVASNENEKFADPSDNLDDVKINNHQYPPLLYGLLFAIAVQLYANLVGLDFGPGSEDSYYYYGNRSDCNPGKIYLIISSVKLFLFLLVFLFLSEGSKLIKSKYFSNSKLFQVKLKNKQYSNLINKNPGPDNINNSDNVNNYRNNHNNNNWSCKSVYLIFSILSLIFMFIYSIIISIYISGSGSCSNSNDVFRRTLLSNHIFYFTSLGILLIQFILSLRKPLHESSFSLVNYKLIFNLFIQSFYNLPEHISHSIIFLFILMSLNIQRISFGSNRDISFVFQLLCAIAFGIIIIILIVYFSLYSHRINYNNSKKDTHITVKNIKKDKENKCNENILFGIIGWVSMALLILGLISSFTQTTAIMIANLILLTLGIFYLFIYVIVHFLTNCGVRVIISNLKERNDDDNQKEEVESDHNQSDLEDKKNINQSI